MKILIVSNQIYADDRVTNPVLQRMQKSLKRDKRVSGVELMPVVYSLTGLDNIRKAAKQSDVIHIHFGGLYALAIWLFLLGVNRPKLITFHGTDIHAKAIATERKLTTKIKIKFNQYASFLSILAFDRVGFVAKEMEHYVPKWLNCQLKKKAFVQSLGVDYYLFQPMEKEEARDKLHLGDKRYALFSTISNTNIKRQDIAEAIVEQLGVDYELLIMCGVRPSDVPLYINACDFLLLTSDEEGSPNIIRECLALNKPVFSVNVGDASLQLSGLKNSCIIDRQPENASKTIISVLQQPYQDNTRETLKKRLDFDCLNENIVGLYEKLMHY